jgi:hypothetical protein
LLLRLQAAAAVFGLAANLFGHEGALAGASFLQPLQHCVHIVRNAVDAVVYGSVQRRANGIARSDWPWFELPRFYVHLAPCPFD